MIDTILASIPSTGRTVIRGASNVGKTRLTAAALARYVHCHGTEQVVLFDFAPTIVQADRIIGGRIDRFYEIPPGVWTGKIEAWGPRIESKSKEEALALARKNAVMAGMVMDQMPNDPRAIFVNDMTIPFQHPSADLSPRLKRWEVADHVVCNAYFGRELGAGPIADREKTLHEAITAWASTVIDLPARD